MVSESRATVKSFESPSETRFMRGKGKVEVVKLDSVTVGRTTMDPGWRWSDHVKPLAGTASCQATHTGTVISGQMRVRMDDGQELELAAGDAFHIPAGHDAWVVGEEPCVTFDFTAMDEFAQA
jgi:quercetin dioxygenase-like cupin family protein